MVRFVYKGWVIKMINQNHFHMFILSSPDRAYDSRYLLICKHVFSEKKGKNIDTHTLNTREILSIY